MAQSRQAGIKKQQSPTRGKIGSVRLALAESPNQINEPDHHDGIQEHSQERMSKSTVVSEPKRRTADAAPDNVKIGRLGGQRKRQRS